MKPQRGVAVTTAFLPAELCRWRGKHFDVAAVVDVLRATTTLLFAIRAGAKRIIPAPSIQEAQKLYEELGGDALLCGERGGRKVPGFHLGNSPSEYTPEAVGGKTLIYASTNGSVLMSEVERVARESVLVSLRNVGAAASLIAQRQPKRILIACAGKEGGASLEDIYAAGLLFERLSSLGVPVCPLDDGTRIALIVRRRFGDDVGELFAASVHGSYLGNELGLWDDLAAASAIDADEIVPIVKDGEVKLA